LAYRFGLDLPLIHGVLHSGVAIAAATMDYLIQKLECFTLFVTHYPLLAKLQVFIELMVLLSVGCG
jgi:DNA mismatch repair ATPase MutS